MRFEVQTVLLLQVVTDALQVELPLIREQLQQLNQILSELQRNTWSCEGDTDDSLGAEPGSEVRY